MQKYIFLILISIIGIFVWSFSHKTETHSEADVDQTETSEVAMKQSDTSAISGWVGPSIEQFFNRTFDGSDFTVGRVLERSAAYIRYYITYKSGELTISGIMNVPTGEGPFPVLILNHGYIDPSIYTNGRGLRREQDYLARQGFVVIHPDYRNHAESSQVDMGELENRLGYVEDVINVVVALRSAKLPFADTDRIGMLGHSMGGGVAQTVAVAVPDLVRAIVLYAPVSMDMRDSYYKYMKNNTRRESRVSERYGPPEENSPVWDALSPKTYVDRIDVPILLFQGTNDSSVDPMWSEATVALLRERGKNVEYVVYPGEGHEFGMRFSDFMQTTTEFFRTQLLVK